MQSHISFQHHDLNPRITAHGCFFQRHRERERELFLNCLEEKKKKHNSDEWLTQHPVHHNEKWWKVYDNRKQCWKVNTLCSLADTDIHTCKNMYTHLHTQTAKHKSCSIAITVWLCRNFVSNDWWDLLQAKKKKSCACGVVGSCVISVCVCGIVQQAAILCVSLNVQVPPPIFLLPLLLMSIAISEAAVLGHSGSLVLR